MGDICFHSRNFDMDWDVIRRILQLALFKCYLFSIFLPILLDLGNLLIFQQTMCTESILGNQEVSELYTNQSNLLY